MARKIGLTVYGFNIQNKENQRQLLNGIRDDGKSFIDIVEEFADNGKGTYTKDEKNETIFTFEDVKKDEIKDSNQRTIFNAIYFKIKTGEYGIETEIVDSNTGRVTHPRTQTEADVMPFGFCIAVPTGDVTRGIIILQSMGNYGITVVLRKKLNECVRNMIDLDFRMIIGQMVPKPYIRRFFEISKLKSIKMVRYDIPDDLADRYGVDRGSKAMEERIIKYPIGFIMRNRQKLDEWLEGRLRYDRLIELPDFVPDDVKLEFHCGGTSTKTISLKNVDRLIITEDITNDIILNKGYPEFESLKIKMKETASDYLRMMGLIEWEE